MSDTVNGWIDGSRIFNVMIHQTYVEELEVCVEDGAVYLLHNHPQRAGGCPNDDDNMRGWKYSWQIGRGTDEHCRCEGVDPRIKFSVHKMECSNE
jgi:hypothetical protein